MRLSLVIIVVACGLAILAPAAYALCEPSTEQQRIAAADVIFEGTALDGATETGIQRFHVGRYLKGNGPEIVNVWTGWVTVRSDGMWGVTSLTLQVTQGSEWRIFGHGSTYDVVSTISCSGSRTLPAPPLVIEPPPPPPPPPPEPEVATPVPPPVAPPADERNDSLVVAAAVLKSVVAVTPPRKTSSARPKTKRPRSGRKSKKAPQRAFRASSRLRRR
jgi:hypothetical protein